MNVLVILSLAFTVMGGAFCKDSLAIDLLGELKAEDRAELIKEDRIKDNAVNDFAEKNSDLLAAKTGSDESKKGRLSDDHESLFKFEDFEEHAEKHDFAKNDDVDLTFSSDYDIAKSSVVKQRSGSAVESAVRDSTDLEFDENKSDHDELLVESDQAKKKSAARQFGGESLLKDRTENLFGSGIDFTFEKVSVPERDHHRDVFGHDDVFSGSDFFKSNSVVDRFLRRGGLHF